MRKFSPKRALIVGTILLFIIIVLIVPLFISGEMSYASVLFAEIFLLGLFLAVIFLCYLGIRAIYDYIFPENN